MSVRVPDMQCQYCKKWVRPNLYYCLVEDGGHECKGRKKYRDGLRNKPKARKPWESRVEDDNE